MVKLLELVGHEWPLLIQATLKARGFRGLGFGVLRVSLRVLEGFTRGVKVLV